MMADDAALRQRCRDTLAALSTSTRVTLEPHQPIETLEQLRQVLDRIDIDTFPIRVRLTAAEAGGGLVVVLALSTRNRDNGVDPIEVGASEAFARGLTASVVVLLVRELVGRTVMHELDEHLLVNGRRVFDPHAPAHNWQPSLDDALRAPPRPRRGWPLRGPSFEGLIAFQPGGEKP